MAIEWDKILDKPAKEYKVKGDQLLSLRQKIDAQEKQISELTKVRNELTTTGDSLKKKVSNLESENLNKEKKIGSLEATIKGNDSKIASFESELKEKVGSISSLESEVSEKGQKTTSLDEKLTELNDSLAQKEAKITELTEELSAKTTKISELDNQNVDLQTQLTTTKSELTTSNEKVSEYETQVTTLITNLENLQKNVMAKDEEIEKLNTKIVELKELIPKKPVYEKAEEVVKGAGCPKCGWTTVEEYKIVDGKRHLIRKYCPNTFCMWTSTEEPKITIAMTSEAPKAEKKEIMLFQVIGTDVKEIKALDSSMVALITDPAQSTVWVWKGQKSSRFDYSEATNLATKIKNEVLKITHAHIVRVEQGKEPSNFPKL